ncbi:uncharacterized membrane protein YgdD (TMEM256/DUF423 family) [Tepidamorphus gemmatus]|jgi:uncharacterized membrane protein YgdD (TMEM256/DUF423 family)|uniref:Uncharacterized membrane protein YgdD (TMEM256/DUF423 family) n=1 Tax=Tepidamorphus gemmatus TaxID=747076 RepID=A0A4V2V020_9HYPH|nr:DUF423 domain-containing protein [Tepidamorphus gemmatus]TCT13559.1 uncharacterized membrane protein YgdD (TMEM256/DUF423 family) [Tepidamorphus gemmatus]
MRPGEQIGLVLAGLFGAAGVAGAAAGAHGGIAHLDVVGPFLIMHAGALAALVALSLSLSPAPRLVGLAGAAIAIGVLLFSVDLALRGLYGLRLAPMAAPAGGTLTIIGWLLLALAALTIRRRRP